MKQIFFAGLAVLMALVSYLLLWPVEIDPQQWEPPVSTGFEGPFEPNQRLTSLELISLGDIHGPEDVVARREGNSWQLFVSSQTGDILKIDPETKFIEKFAKTGGVPLGMEFDQYGNLIVADAYKGLLSIAPDGSVSVLTDTFEGAPILYADDLDIDEEGVIYFSDASTKFGAEASGSTMNGSVLEIFEHGRTGRVLAYNPETNATTLVMDGLSFANGVAIASDGQSILINETGEYRVLRRFVKGPRSDETEILFENLPGFPDNINRGPATASGEATYFLGLAGPRVASVDALADKPFLRSVAWRLPDALKPAAAPYGFVMQFTESGEIIETWQDPDGAYPVTTGALAPGDGYLYITSLEAHDLGRKPYP